MIEALVTLWVFTIAIIVFLVFAVREYIRRNKKLEEKEELIEHRLRKYEIESARVADRVLRLLTVEIFKLNDDKKYSIDDLDKSLTAVYNQLVKSTEDHEDRDLKGGTNIE